MYDVTRSQSKATVLVAEQRTQVDTRGENFSRHVSGERAHIVVVFLLNIRSTFYSHTFALVFRSNAIAFLFHAISIRNSDLIKECGTPEYGGVAI